MSVCSFHVQPAGPSSLSPPSAPNLHATPSPSSPQEHTHDQLVDEAGRLELEIGQLRSRIREIGEQTRELASFPDAVLELTGQLSIQQLRLDEKTQRLSVVHDKLQAMTTIDSRHAQLPAYPGTPSGLSGRIDDDTLPDFDSLSLEDAEWFQAGLPR